MSHCVWHDSETTPRKPHVCDLSGNGSGWVVATAESESVANGKTGKSFRLQGKRQRQRGAITFGGKKKKKTLARLTFDFCPLRSRQKKMRNNIGCILDCTHNRPKRTYRQVVPPAVTYSRFCNGRGRFSRRLEFHFSPLLAT